MVRQSFFFFGCAELSLLCGFSPLIVGEPCGRGGYSFVAMYRLLTAVTSLVAEHRF